MNFYGKHTYHSADAWSMPSEICRAPERRAPKPTLNLEQTSVSETQKLKLKEGES
jgi:hypothetical protein